ncbi:MAG: signal transduction histidine kinase, partial [Lentisphaeria bacterium]
MHPRSSGRRKVSRLARMLTLVLLSLCMSAIALSFCLRLIVFSGENDVTRSAQLDNVAKFAITHLIIAANNNDITELQRRLDQLAVANNLDFTKLTLNPAHASNPSDSGTGVPLSLAATGSVNQNQNLPMASRHSYGFSYGGGTANLEISVNEHYMSSTTDKTITHLFKHFLLDVIVIALLTITFAYSMRRLLLRHIIHMSDYITTADYDDFTHNLTLERRIATAENRDELDDVADAYESMRSALVSQTEKRRVVERALKEEKQQKQEIRRLIENAKNANKAKSEFIATMSHEIRTPLNGVVGMVEMLRDTPLNNNQKHYLDVLYRSGESLLEIINDILDYSKIESGKMLLEKIEFNIEELISNCFKLFVATAGKRDIELFSDISPDIPTHLIGDPTRLRQIVVNLVGNAFKFTSNGYVIVRVRLDSKNTGDKVKLLFSICDSGIGISREDQAHLFQAFRQADTSTTRKFGGSGLGLAICKQLV